MICINLLKSKPSETPRNMFSGTGCFAIACYVVALGVICVTMSGCAMSYHTTDIAVSEGQMAQIQEIYNPFLEKGFCLGDEGVNNVLPGGPFWSEVPLCRKGEYVMHTHPIIGEWWASPIDEAGWDEYSQLYGDSVFGIVGVGWVRFYTK